MNRVEAVTVCVGYADFLAATAPENAPLLDNWIVITSPDDEETRMVCRKHNIFHILSEDYKRGGPFNKARMINRALDQISAKDWILHVDADIVLPRQFRNLLEWADLDERCIYGADRQRVIGYDKWKAFKQYVGGWDNHTHELGWWWHPEYPNMSRLVSSIHGYTPIGAFQLWNSSESIQYNSHQKRYPIDHGDAARTDHQFSLQWDRRYRQILPEVLLLHLESEAGVHGANWCGRTTKPFGPAIKVKEDARWPKRHKPPERAPEKPPGHKPTDPEPPHHPSHQHNPEPPRHRREDS
jgi:hypothetical protein